MDVDGTQGKYYAIIWVGTPPQQVTAQFDSGSCTIFIPSCTGAACTGVLAYNSEVSTSGKPTGISRSLTYGTNVKTTVSGTVTYESVSNNVQGANAITGFSMTTVPGGTSLAWGLCANYAAYNKNTTPPAASFTQALLDAGLSSQKVYSTNYSPATKKGTFTFGSYDLARPIVWSPNVSGGYPWQVLPTSIN